MTAITIWIPTLRKGAPSNRAGMAPGGPYRTRKEALEHEHWANQAAHASAKRVSVHDGMAYVDGFDGEELARQVCEHDNTDAVAEHIRAKRWASAIKAALGWE
jgi:hypothetical protein